jgi:alcohol dehydrogenase (cytochrome c)
VFAGGIEQSQTAAAILVLVRAKCAAGQAIAVGRSSGASRKEAGWVRKRYFVIGIAAVIAASLAAMVPAAKRAIYSSHPVQAALFAGLARNYVWSWTAPSGATTTEVNPNYHGAAAAASPSRASQANLAGDWPSYNRTLTSERYSPLDQINTRTIGNLTVLCTYDTREYTNFESGLIMVNGALVGATHADIFSLDPATCAENWRTHEDVPAAILSANRGVAYAEGMLFRGAYDGRVLAYDFGTGKRIWQTEITNNAGGEFVPGAPIAWNGLVFIGVAGGDSKGSKGRMYALDAKTGKIVWEFYLVPKSAEDAPRGPQGDSPLDTSTWANGPGIPISGGAAWTSYTLDPATGDLYVPVGNSSPVYAIGLREGENLFTDSVVVLDARTGAYRRHFKLVPRDWHDWDVSSPPSLIETMGGKRLMSVAPKDGHLYGIDLDANALLYRVPVTKIENAEEPFAVGKEVRYCPGASGGAEWNGPAYDPSTNLVLIGEVDWCTTVSLQTDDEVREVRNGSPWPANAMLNPLRRFGKYDEPGGSWGGWVYAVDADTGVWKWRLRSNYPVVSGMTPTAGGLAFFGDTGGNFYALDAATGQKLWGRKMGGAVGGGVITYAVSGSQKVAVATGFANIFWPTQVATGKIVVLGLGP